MTEISDQLIEAIQASGVKASIVVAGGGIGALHALLVHPGASRFVLEAQIPYSPEAMFDYLGEEVESYCSERAAAAMAGRAFERALVCRLAGKGQYPILGIACTAALATTRTRKGRDRAFFCIKGRHDRADSSLELPAGSRAGQDLQVSSTLLDMIARFVEKTGV
jgi:hypothetical protein